MREEGSFGDEPAGDGTCSRRTPPLHIAYGHHEALGEGVFTAELLKQNIFMLLWLGFDRRRQREPVNVVNLI